ncbi:NF-kappa-B inhibitor cactus [Coccinella septempunctata]|uniref:Cactus n=1 Tax=Coccinella septempunctata TaxID=41139 RepID=A0A894YVP8_COCSE|nr:NF-kappa-B inhibitor cactus [Coccinella septempunctata]QRY06426.1 cactus [Coccinella septempunctata]
MSRRAEQTSHSVSDTSKKNISENEYTDSGFLSSGNMIVSEEITDELEDVDDEEKKPKNVKKTEYKSDLHQDKVEEAMYVDSGVMCLSEDLCNLSIEENPNLNDLGSKRKPVECDRNRQSQIISDRENPTENAWISFYQQDEDGDTELHLAIANGILDVAAALIQMAPHPRLLDTANDDALTPLHIAVSRRLTSIVRLLIIAGARPGPRNLSGDSPLHIAARLGDLDCCKAILYPVQSQEREQMVLRYSAQLYTTYDVEQWNHEGRTCLHVAAQYGHIEILRHLVWFGADVNAGDGTQGLTALHYAVIRKDINLLSFLLYECDKIDLNRTNYGGLTAYKMCRDQNIIEMFHQKGVSESPYNSEDDYCTDSEDEEASFGSGFIPSMVTNRPLV